MVENATADESSTRQAIKGYLRRHCFVCGCGLSYIHKELFLYCGKLNCGTVLFNRNKMIKINTFIQFNLLMIKTL